MSSHDFRIAVFDTKPYDRAFFEEENKKYGFDITYFEAKLRPRTVGVTAGFHAICAPSASQPASTPSARS